MDETGMPIVKQTNCKVGQHVFIWVSSGLSRESREPMSWTRCDCGLKTWREAGYQLAKAAS